MPMSHPIERDTPCGPTSRDIIKSQKTQIGHATPKVNQYERGTYTSQHTRQRTEEKDVLKEEIHKKVKANGRKKAKQE